MRFNASWTGPAERFILFGQIMILVSLSFSVPIRTECTVDNEVYSSMTCKDINSNEDVEFYDAKLVGKVELMKRD